MKITNRPMAGYWYYIRLEGKSWAITTSQRKAGGLGRFGGGWEWKLGFQAGHQTCIISLLFFQIRFSRGLNNAR